MIERIAVLLLLLLSSCKSNGAPPNRPDETSGRMAELLAAAKERENTGVRRDVNAQDSTLAMIEAGECDDLSGRLDALAHRVRELERANEDNAALIQQLVDRSRPTEAILDPVKSQCVSAWNDYGCFVVSVVSVSPEADGVAVRLKVGNLAAASLSNCVLVVRWGRRFPRAVDGVPFEQTYSDWEAELKSVRVVVPHTLRSGEWTPIDVGLPGAVAAEFGHLRVAVEASVIGLRE